MPGTLPDGSVVVPDCSLNAFDVPRDVSQTSRRSETPDAGSRGTGGDCGDGPRHRPEYKTGVQNLNYKFLH